MATQQNSWEEFFKDDKFIKNYTTGEHITGQFALTLLEQSGLITYANGHPDEPLVVFDNACGTGIISSILHNKLDDAVKAKWKLTCGDFSPGMIEYTRRRMAKENWNHAEVKIVDAQDTQLPSDYFSHVVTAFAYMALPKSRAALDDTTRILRPGGTIAFSTWIEPGWVSVFTKALSTLPGDLPFPSPKEFLVKLGDGEWYSKSWIESQLEQRGFVDIEVRAESKSISLKVPDFVEMSMIMFPMIGQNFWTEQQREANSDKVRPALEKYLVDLYGKDGEIPMEWTAILSTARKPN